MDTGTQIPGHWVIADWRPEPVRPLRVIYADVYRWMRGSFGPPGYVVVGDVAGTRYEFGFDSFLCRLFAGARDEGDEAAAWVVAGSPLESEFVAVVRAALPQRPEWSWLADYIEKALSWGPPRDGTPAR